MKSIAENDLEHILKETKDIWEQIRNKSVFLTGGTGFYGLWLSQSFIYINRLLDLNARLTILSRRPEEFLQQYSFYKSESSIDFIKGDVLNFEFPSDDYGFVIHAATDADAALNTYRPLLMLDTITAGTRRVLDFAKQIQPEAFLFASSGAVYGKQPPSVTHIKETDNFPVEINNPRSAYAEGKRLAELYCSIYHAHYNIPVKIARGFAFIGPYLPLDKHFAVGNFLLNAINGEDIIIKGDGTPYRSYLYAADLTIFLWKILLQGESNVPYNVGSDEDYDLRTVANTVARLTPGVEVRILAKQDPAKPVERYVPDINLIKKKLNVKVSFNLAESIRKTKEFHARV